LLILLLAFFCPSGHSLADDDALAARVAELEARLEKVEQLLDEQYSDDRWKDNVLWSRIKTGMSESDVRKILGDPARKEQAVFMTWYYHEKSNVHSYVWFDEGKVLGWEGRFK